MFQDPIDWQVFAPRKLVHCVFRRDFLCDLSVVSFWDSNFCTAPKSKFVEFYFEFLLYIAIALPIVLKYTCFQKWKWVEISGLTSAFLSLNFAEICVYIFWDVHRLRVLSERRELPDDCGRSVTFSKFSFRNRLAKSGWDFENLGIASRDWGSFLSFR